MTKLIRSALRTFPMFRKAGSAVEFSAWGL